MNGLQLPPHLASRFRPLRLLGAGSSGDVYEAVRLADGQRVAIKLLVPRPDADPDAAARFAHEAAIASRLLHPDVVPALEHDLSADGTGFIVYEFVNGCSLRARLRVGPVSEYECLLIGIGLADVLSSVHGQGVLHRDLKPENVLLEDRCRPRLIDFGIAKSPESSVKTRDGIVYGTPGYVAPEQLESQEARPASDQFALGVILYEMLSGSRPFSGATPAEEAMARLRKPPVELLAAAPQVTETLAAVVMKMLRREPAERYRSMREVKRALQVQALQITASRAAPGRETAPAATRSSRPSLPRPSATRPSPSARPASSASSAAFASAARSSRSPAFRPAGRAGWAPVAALVLASFGVAAALPLIGPAEQEERRAPQEPAEPSGTMTRSVPRPTEPAVALATAGSRPEERPMDDDDLERLSRIVGRIESLDPGRAPGGLPLDAQVRRDAATALAREFYGLWERAWRASGESRWPCQARLLALWRRLHLAPATRGLACLPALASRSCLDDAELPRLLKEDPAYLLSRAFVSRLNGDVRIAITLLTQARRRLESSATRGPEGKTATLRLWAALEAYQLQWHFRDLTGLKRAAAESRALVPLCRDDVGAGILGISRWAEWKGIRLLASRVPGS